MAVVIDAPTGVVYEHQCAGVACESRLIEGYLVPLGGSKFVAEEGRLEPRDFTAVFHVGQSCAVSISGAKLTPDQLCALRSAIAAVPYWNFADNGEVAARSPLELDEARLADVTEAWVPVRTPAGPGILMWNNCD